MEFLAVADVSFCDPINDFTFKWQIDGLASSSAAENPGNSLKLPAGTFEAGKLIQVTVVLLNNESLTMASVSELLSWESFLFIQFAQSKEPFSTL